MTLLELISQLRSANIQITLDGDKLKIKAPQGALTTELKLELKEKKQEIIEFLQESNRVSGAKSAIPVAPRNASMPLSYNQLVLWTMEQRNPGTIANNLPMAYLFTGDLNKQALEQAINAVLKRHEVLRMTVGENDLGEPTAKYNAYQKFELALHSIHIEKPELYDARIREAIKEFAFTPFELSQGPLYRFHLIDIRGTAQNQQLFVACLHHLVSDGMSQNLLAREIAIGYASLVQGHQPVLPPLTIQYADFVSWQQARLSAEHLAPEIEFWRQQISGVAPLLNLPTDRPRPPIQTTNGSKWHFVLPQTTTDLLTAFCREQKLTLFMGLMAAFQVVLARHADQDQFCIGMPTAGRFVTELEPLIGFFVNGVLVRVDVRGNPTWREHIDRVKKTLSESLSHQDTPIQLIVDQLNVPRNPSYTPLAQVGFQLQDFSGAVSGGADENELFSQFQAMTNIKMESIPLDVADSKFDMIVSLTKQVSELSGYVEYNTDLFDNATIKVLMDHLNSAIKAMVTDSSSLISTAPLVPEADLRNHLGAKDDEVILPLTATQMAFIQDVQLRPETKQYAIGFSYEIKGSIALSQLQQAIEATIADYSSIRARFVRSDLPATNDVYQIISPLPKYELEVIQFAAVEKLDLAVQRHFESWCYIAQNPFQDTLLRFQIITNGEGRHWLLMACHHIIIDGISGMVVLQRIIDRYQSLVLDSTLKASKDSWPEAIAASAETLDSEDSIAYWQQQAQTVAPLSFSQSAKWQQSTDYQIKRLKLKQDLLTGIKHYCRQHKTHPLNLYKLVMGLLVKLYCRPEQDFVLWDIQSGRSAETEDTVGVLYQQVANVIPLASLAEQSTAPEFFSMQRHYRRAIRNHTQLSLAKWNEILPQGTLNFQFNYFNFLAEVECNGSSSVPYFFSSHVDRTAQLFVKDFGPEVVVELWYDAGVFVDLNWLQRFESIIAQIVSDEARPFCQLDYLLDDEKTADAVWNHQPVPAPKMTDVVTGFQQQCAKTPAATALIYNDFSMTYQALDTLSNQMSHCLASLGVRAGDRVGICLGRSQWMVVAIWAVLKQRAAYVPIDSAYPSQRIEYILEDSVASALISERCLAERLPSAAGVRLWIDDFATQANSFPGTAPNHSIQVDDAIYTIYTSGSTGQPKGASVTHGGVTNLQHWYLDACQFSALDKTLIISAFGFDLTQKNLFAPLLAGGAVVIPAMEPFDAEVVVQQIKRHQITHINCAPSAFYSLVESCDNERAEALASLRWVYLGGEPIRLAALESWLQHPKTKAQLVNSYGPTECTDVVAYHPLSTIESSRDLIPIGKPIYDTELRLVDNAMAPVPHGLVGEIIIAGAGVGLGYLNKPELTQEAFVQPAVDSPLNTQTVWYKTGDLGRYWPDGNIEYIGRKDFQVKVRGLRIELGEIESALRAIPGISDALIIVHQDNLVAYGVSQDSACNNWQSQLRSVLPDYMVPNQLLLLPEWPLTPNGKIDRQALPDPLEGSAGTDYVAPRNDIEAGMVDIWSQVLKRSEIGIDDNFFELGGHSLLANQIVARVRRIYQIDLPIRELILHPTIRQQAEKVANNQKNALFAAIEPVTRDQRIPLSAAQQRLWLLDQIQPGNAAYHVPSIVKIKGNLDLDYLEQAFTAVVNRHEGLRTIILEDDQGPLQGFLTADYWPVLRINGRECSEQDLRKQVASLVAQPFELNQGPLFRAAFIATGDDETILIIVLHHIITDGWSNSLLIKEMAEAYLQLQTRDDVWFPALKLQYADYAFWQQQYFAQESFQQHVDYWCNLLADVPVLELPLDYARPALQTFNGKTFNFTLQHHTSVALQALAQEHQCTPFMVLLAIYTVFLQRYTGQDDFAIGTPIAGRDHTELEPIVGFFVNTLAIRVRPQSQLTFTHLLEMVKARTLADFEHQQVPFEQIVEELNPARDMSRSPIFQVMMAYQNLPGGDFAINDGQFGDIQLAPFEVENVTAKFEQTLTFWPGEQGLQGALTLNSDLFNDLSGERFVRHLINLCDAIAQEPDKALYEYQILAEEEISKQLIHWNQTETAYRLDQRIEHWIYEAAQQHSDNIALSCGQSSLTYRALIQRSSALYQSLVDTGIKKGDFVGLIMDRHEMLMPAIIGILQAGAIYVPIDSRYPADRITYICEQSNIRVMVSRREIHCEIPETIAQLWVEEVAEDSTTEFAHQPFSINDLIYVIYTSGSTGLPKGTGAYHRSEANLLHWYTKRFAMTAQDRVLLMSAIGFDLTQKNLFAPLIVGAQLVIPEFQEYDPYQLLDLIAEQKVTWINCAPSAFYPLADDPAQWEKLASLRYVFLGGEPINLDRLRPWLLQTRCKLVNSYGPTECTDIAAWHQIDPGQPLAAGQIPIGRPNDNVALYILGEQQELLPLGAVGELCISGAGVGPGYLNQPDLTSQVFLPNPFSSQAPSGHNRIYRTGDRARYLENGDILFLGRKDHQIKLRGYRIEVGEIQAVINSDENISDSLVAVIKSPQGIDQLVAWIASSKAVDGSTEKEVTRELQHKCRAALPSYMLPDAWVMLNEFPLTPNGKVDRKALPMPEWGNRDSLPVQPRNETEVLLQEIWQHVLQVSDVGIFDNFFSLGGHSLLATQVAARVLQRTGIKIQIRDLMAEPTIAALAARVNSSVASDSGLPLIAVSRQQRLPVSFAQQRLWLLDKIEGESTAYHIPVVLRLKGALDSQRLEQALRKVYNHHEGLRTVFPQDAEGPYQSILPIQDWPLPVTDLSVNQQLDDDVEFELKRLIAIELMTHFDLAKGPLFRARLFKLSTEEYVFCVVIHHIVSDGWSMNLLVKDLANCYAQLTQQSQAFLKPLAIQYADFALWQRQRLNDAERERLVQYWQHQLADVEALDLPLDFPRPPRLTHKGDSVTFELDKVVVGQLTGLAHSNDTTLFTVLMANFAVVLKYYSGQTDFCIGTPVAGREHTELESVVGFFVNTVAVRVLPKPELSVGEFIQQVKQTLMDGFSHQELPFEQIVETIDPQRDMSRAPIFQVMLAYQNLPEQNNSLPLGSTLGALELSAYDPGITASKYELNMNLWDNGDSGLAGSLQFNTDLFSRASISKLLQNFRALARCLSEANDCALSQLDFLPDSEKQRQLLEWNQTSINYPATTTVHAAIDIELLKRPHNKVITCGKDSLTAEQLFKLSNQFAHYLVAQEVAPGDRVAVCIERNLHLMSVLLGVLKAGATYVPLDPSYPKDRLDYIINSAAIKVVITETDIAANLPQPNSHHYWRDILVQLADFDSGTPKVAVSYEQPLYLIFTSGSTGTPKGTGVSHRSEMNLLHWYCNEFTLAESDNVLLLSAIGFDLTQKNLFAPLLCGATLVIPEFQEFDIQLITSLIHNAQITWLNCAPSALYPLQDETRFWSQLESLRLVFLGGEPINLERLANWLRQSNCQLINSYGPTECTDIAAWYPIHLERDLMAPALPIGRPNYNVELYVLGESLELLPVGAIGELCISGAGVGIGYINNPEQTAQAFVNNPYFPDTTLYRTGDRVRYRDDGIIEYLGRKDHQIKLRGYRIEVGEIQSVVRRLPAVLDCLVDIYTQENGVQSLVAWVSGDSIASVTEHSLQEHCKSLLPSFMVPEYWVMVSEFPLTPNGKIDRKKLPQPSIKLDANFEAPVTDLERRLAPFWVAILGVENIGRNHNFFQLGGQSLLATQLVSRVSSELDQIITVRTLFDNPTLAGFAKALSGESGHRDRPPIELCDYLEPAPLTYGQQRLWFFEQLNPGTATNNMPVALKLEGAFNPALIEMALNEIIRRHASLRTRFYASDSGEPLQQVIAQCELKLPIEDLSQLDEATAQQHLAQAIKENGQSSFDLGAEPLARARWVIKRSGPVPENYLLFCMHHIISDGASLVILFRELMTLYLAYSEKLPAPLPELNRQYIDYAHWQRNWLTDQTLENQLNYWKSQLAGAPALLELPLDFPRPAVQKNEGLTANFAFSHTLSERVLASCQEQGITPFMFLLAGWQILLAKYSGQNDVLVGVPSLGRHTPELEPVIGFFIQSLVLRGRLKDNPSVLDCLQNVRNTVLDAFSNSDVPIDLIVERLAIPRNAAYTPLVQVAFQLLDDASHGASSLLEASSSVNVAGAKIEMVSTDTQSAKFDLTLNVVQRENLFSLSLEYDRNLFKADTIERLLAQYCSLCEQMLDQMALPIKALSLEQSQHELLNGLGLSSTDFEDVIPLTAMQHDMFMDNLVNPASLQSSHGWVFEINNPRFNPQCWEQAIQYLTQAQPMLRTRFVSTDRPYLDMGYLAVSKTQQVTIKTIDLTDKLQEAKALAADLIYRPYAVETDSLVNHYLIKEGEDHYTAVIAVHHGVLDGSALNSYWLQLAEIYRQLSQHKAPTINAVSFKDFVRHDRATTDTQSVVEFWRAAFANVEPLDFTLPSPTPVPGKRVQVEERLTGAQWQSIKEYCRQHRITPALYFKCLYGLLINTYCRADADFLVQETYAGRIKNHGDALGCYIQEVPFIFSQQTLSANKPFSELVTYARQYQKTIKNYRNISIGQQRELSPHGRIGFMYNFYQFVSPAEFLGKTECPYSLASDPADNVQFVVTEQEGEVTLSLYYHRHLFNDYGFLARISALSDQVIGNHKQLMSELKWVIDPSESITLLETWNNTEKGYDLQQTVHNRFETQVIRTPQAIAIVDDSCSLTYQEVNERANQLAHWLQAQAVKINDLVGLYAERSCDFLVGILGIMKAGGAYVALDPKYPQDRIEYMIQNSEVSVLVTQSHLVGRIAGTGDSLAVICLDTDQQILNQLSTHNLGLPVKPEGRAYMIYTSGSTGMPKGAIVRHNGALNHIEAERDVLKFPAAFNFLQTAPASSDISVWQYLGPVICGGKVVVLDDVTQSEKLFTLVNRHQIQVVELVPVALQLLMEYVRTLPKAEQVFTELDWMMATGEAVSVDLVNDWLRLFPHIPVVNAYGPTEAADDVIQCAIHKPLPASQRSVPIGKPLANLGVYLVDDYLRLVPPGIPGEICIGGIGVGEGYWKNPEKTAASFVSNPFKEGDTLYRTGDLGRWLEDGSVEYLDRIDNQVKVRGFRIELGEVESALSSIAGVRENVVIIRDDLPGGTALAAYVVLSSDAHAEASEGLSAPEIRAALRAKLPDFMVPAAVSVLESLPLTPAGKIDRKSLPRPDSIQTASGEYTKPRNPTEQEIADVWQSLMNIEKISVKANFFELGGHSLIAVRIISRINKIFNTQLSVARLLTAQTIEQLALMVEQGSDLNQQLIPLSGKGGESLFLIHPIGGDVLCYTDLAQALAGEFSVYGIRAQGLDGLQAPVSNYNALIDQYVDLIKAQDDHGPYHLGGQSLGGIFALSVAQRLEALGCSVAGVVLIDSYSPEYLRRELPINDAMLTALFQSSGIQEVDALKQSDADIQSLFIKGQQLRLIPQELEFNHFKGLYEVAKNNHWLASQANLELPAAKVLHFTALDNPAAVPARESWNSQGMDFQFVEADGGHETIMQGAIAKNLAVRISQFLHNQE